MKIFLVVLIVTLSGKHSVIDSREFNTKKEMAIALEGPIFSADYPMADAVEDKFYEVDLQDNSIKEIPAPILEVK